MTCDCDGDLPDFMAEKTVIARKLHKCCECRRPIQVGESHRSVRGKWDGEVQTFRQCARCSRVADALYREGACLWFGGLREELRERTRNRHRDWSVTL